jgi:hypothetical protein
MVVVGIPEAPSRTSITLAVFSFPNKLLVNLLYFPRRPPRLSNMKCCFQSFKNCPVSQAGKALNVLLIQYHT